MENTYNQQFNPDPNPAVAGPITQQMRRQQFQEYKHPNINLTYTRDASGAAYKGRGSYDSFLMPDQVQAYVRGQNQSVLEQGFNGVVNLFPSVATKILGGAASWIGAGYGVLSGEGAIKGATENPISQGLRDFSEYVNENILPVHKTRDYYEGNAVSRLGTTSWLFNDFADGAAFAISAYLTGNVMHAVFNKLGSVTEMLAAANQSRPMLKAITGNLAKGLAATKNATGLGTSHIATGVYNTLFEASAEAHDARIGVEQMWDANIYKAKQNGASQQEIQDMEHKKELGMDEVMSSVFTANAILLSFTNTLFEAKWAIGSAKSVNEILERKLIQKAFAGEGIDPVLAEFIKAPNLLKAAGKGILAESYLEENAQAAFQSLYTNKYADPNFNPEKEKGFMNKLRRGLVDAQGIGDRMIANGIGFSSNLFAALLKGVTLGNIDVKGLQTTAGSDEDEASQAMFAALGISGPMSAKSAMMDYKQELEYGKQYGERATNLFKLNKQANKYAVDNYTTPLKTFKHTDENGNTIETFVNPATGKQEIDPEKFAAMHRRINNIMEKHKNALKTAAVNDEVGFNMNKDQTLWEYAYDLYSSSKNTGGLKDHELDEILRNNPLFDEEIMKEANEEGLLKNNVNKIKQYFKEIQDTHKKYSKLSDNIVNTKEDNTPEEAERILKDNIDIAIRRDLARTQSFLEHKRESLLDNASYLSDAEDHTILDDQFLNSLDSIDKQERYKDLVEYNQALEDLAKGEKSTTRSIIESQISGHSRLQQQAFEAQKEKKQLEKQKEEAKTEAERVEIQKKISKINDDVKANNFRVKENDALEGVHYVEHVDTIKDPLGNPVDIRSATYSISDIGLRKIGAQRIYSEKYRQENKVAMDSVRSNTQAKLIADEVINQLLDDLLEKWKVKSKFNFAQASQNDSLENVKLPPEELEEFIDDLKQLIKSVKSVSLGNPRLLTIAKSLEKLANDLRSVQGMRQAIQDLIDTQIIPGLTKALNVFTASIERFEIETLQENFLESVQEEIKKIADNINEIDNSQYLTDKEKKILYDELFRMYNSIIESVISAAEDNKVDLGMPADMFIGRHAYPDSISFKAAPEALSKLTEDLINILGTELATQVLISSFSDYSKKISEYEKQISNLENFLETELDSRRIRRDIADIDIINNNIEDYNIAQAFNRVIQNAENMVTDYFYVEVTPDGRYMRAPYVDKIETLTDTRKIIENLDLLYSANLAYENRDDISEELKQSTLKKIEAYFKLLMELKEEVAKNEIKLDRKNQQYLDYKIQALLRSLGVGPDGDINNSLTDFIQEIMSSANIDFKTELQYQIKENNLAGLTGLLSIVRSTLTTEQKEKFNTLIDEQSSVLYAKFKTKYSEQFDTDFSEGFFKAFIKNPSYYARFIINSNKFLILSGRGNEVNSPEVAKIKANPKGALFQIREHNNFLEALNALDKDTLLNEKEKANLKAFITDVLQTVQGMYDLKMHINTDYSYMELKKQVETITTAKGIKLSQQQFASVIDLVLFMTDQRMHKGENEFGNAAIFSGVLGSGKSTVAAIATDIANKITGRTDNNHILATGHVEVSSEAINKKLNPTSTENRKVGDLTIDDLTDKTLLIVDEAFATANNDLIKLQKMVEEVNTSREKDNKLKILFIGDMSQNRADSKHLLTEILVSTLTPGAIAKHSAKNATIISPLATTYRTSIDSIALAFTEFKDQVDPVQVIEVASTISSLSNYTPTALGVLQNDSSDIEKFLANRNTTRSAVLIVNTRAEASAIAARIESAGKTLKDLNLQVLSYADVQSITVDESYVFLDKNAPIEKGDKFTEKTFNTAMYTSIGRAVKFVVISNSTGVAIRGKVGEVNEAIDMSEGIKQNLDIAHTNMLNGFQDAAERYFGAEKQERVKTEKGQENPTTKGSSEIQVEIDSNFTDDAVEEDENFELIPFVIDTDINPDTNPLNSVKELGSKNSKYTSLTSITNENISKVMEGRTSSDKIEGVLVKRYKTTNSGTIALVSLMAPDKQGNYHEVAVLTNEELNGQFKGFLDSINSKNEVITNINKDFSKEDLAKYEIGKIPISYMAQAHYDNSGEEKDSDFSELLKTWAIGFYGNNWENEIPETMYDKTTKKFSFSKNHNQVSVLTRGLYNSLGLFERGFNTGLIGMPILRIKNYRKDSKNPKEQFIILNTKEAHTVDGWYNKTIKPIKQFYEVYTNLKNILDSVKEKRDPRLGDLYLGNSSGSFNTDLVDAFARKAYTYGAVALKTTHIEILKDILKNPKLGFYIDSETNEQNLTEEQIANIARALDKLVRMLYNEENSSQLVIEESEFEALQEEYKGKYKFKIAKSRKSKVTDKKYIWISAAVPNVNNATDTSNYEPFKPTKLSLGNSEVQKAFNTFARAFGSRRFGESTTGGFDLNNIGSYTADGVKTDFNFPKSILALRHGSRNNNWNARLRYLMRWIITDDERATQADGPFKMHAPTEADIQENPDLNLEDVKKEFYTYSYNNPNRVPIGNDELLSKVQERFPEKYDALLEHVSREVTIPITSYALEQIANIQPNTPILDSSGRTVRSQISKQVQSVDLSNADKRSKLEKATSNKFSKVTTNNVSVDLGQTILEEDDTDFIDYLAKNVDSQEDKFQEIKNKKEHLKVFSKSDNVFNPIYKLIEPFLDNIKIIVVPSKDNSYISYINNKGEKVVVVPSTNIDSRYLLHELIHAITIEAFDTETPTAKQLQFVKRITAIQNAFDEQLSARGLNKKNVYEKTSSPLGPKEFLANLSNPKFVELLKEFRMGKTSLLDTIIKAIIDLFFTSDTKNQDFNDLVFTSLREFLELETENIEKAPPVENKEDTEIDAVQKQIDLLAERIKNSDAESIDIIKKAFSDIKALFEDYKQNNNLNALSDVKALLKRLNKYNFAIPEDKSNPTSEFSTEHGTSIFQLINIFGTNGAANRAIFFVKKHLYLELNSNDNVNNLQSVRDDAHFALSLSYISIYNKFMDDLKEVDIEGTQDVKSIADLKGVIEKLQKEIRELDKTDLEYSFKTLDLTSLISILNKYQFDLESLNLLRGDVKIFNTVLSYLFKNWNQFTNSKKSTEDTEEDLEEDPEDANLKSAIQKNEEVNIVKSFSTSVKNYLNLIPIYDGTEIVKFVNVNAAIAKIASLFHNDVDFFSLEDPTYVADMLESVKAESLLGPSELAVIDRVQETLQTFISDVSIERPKDSKGRVLVDEVKVTSTLPDNYGLFINFFEDTFDAMNPSVTFISPVDKSDTSIKVKGLNAYEAKAKYGDKVVVKQYKNIKELLNKYADNDSALELIKKLYNKHNAYNDLSNLRTYLGSLMQVKYMQSKTDYNYFTNKKTTTYTSITPESTTTKSKNTIANLILDFYNGEPMKIFIDGVGYQTVNISAGKPIPSIYSILLRNMDSVTFNEQKEKAVLEFLKIYGVNNLLNAYSKYGKIKNRAYKNMVNKLALAILQMHDLIVPKNTDKKAPLSNIMSYSNAQDKNSERDNFNSDLEYRDELIEQIKNASGITSKDGFIGLVEQLYKANSEIRAMSQVKSLEGKSLPEFIPSSFAREAFKDVMRFKNNKKGQSRFFNHKFFSKNIFLDGLSTIVSATNRHNTSKVNSFIFGASGNSFGQKFELQFNSAFLAQIANTASYYQPIFQQGEAVKGEMPRVNFLDFGQVRKAFDLMLQQLLDIEPELQKDKKYYATEEKERVNFTLYNKAKKLIPHNTEDLANQELRDRLVKVMMREAFEETKKIIDKFKAADGQLTEESKGAFKKIVASKDQLKDIFSDAQTSTELSTANVKDDSESLRTLQLDDPVYSNDEYESHMLYDESPKVVNYPQNAVLDMLMYSFVLNNYINSYQLSQLILGDFNVYGDIETLVKRAQMSASPGYFPLIEPTYGIPRYANILITPDVLTPKGDYSAFLGKFAKAYNKTTNSYEEVIGQKELERIAKRITSDIERTDGVMFMTPRYFNKLQKAFGSGLNLKNVLKDQAFGWSEQRIGTGEKFATIAELEKHLTSKGEKLGSKGVQYMENNDGTFELLRISMKPIGLKNAMIVLSDDFLAETEHSDRKALIHLRDLMDNSELDMLAFKSANKIGNPTTLQSVFDTEGSFDAKDLSNLENSTVKIDMSLFKIQYNPHSTSKTTALPRQMLYFASALRNNTEVAADLYSTLSHLESVLHSNSFSSTRLNKREFERRLKEGVKRGDENFTVINALNANLTVDHPAIANLAINALGSNFNRVVSKLRTKGGKLVLQSDIGVRLKLTDKNGKKYRRKLKHGKTRSGTPYAEAIIPKQYLSQSHIDALKAGKDLFLFDAMFGFRIPTGELNSGMLIKVVDFYESNDGKSNIAIMPDLEIMKQGWDFDVDSLFIMTFEDAKKDYTFRNKEGNIEFTLSKNTPVGFNPLEDDDRALYGKSNFEGLEKRIITEISNLNKDIAVLEDRKQKFTTHIDTETVETTKIKKETLALIEKEIKSVKAEIKNYEELRVTLLKNRVTNGFIKLFSNPVNNSRIVDITSTDVIKDMIKYLESKKGVYSPDVITDLSFVDQNIDYYQRVNEAAKGIGIYAKGSNVNAYLENAWTNEELRKQWAKDGINTNNDYAYFTNSSMTFKVNGQTVNSLSNRIKILEDLAFTYSLNSDLLNGFLDALKNPDIFNIGLNGSNANLVETAISMGKIPFEAIVLLFNNPTVRSAFKNKKIRALLQEIEREIYSDTEIFKLYEDLDISTDELIDAYKFIDDLDGLEVENEEGVSDQDNTDSEERTEDEFSDLIADRLSLEKSKERINQIFNDPKYKTYNNEKQNKEEVKPIFRKLSMIYHPDKTPGIDDEIFKHLIKVHEKFVKYSIRPGSSKDTSTSEPIATTVKSKSFLDPHTKALFLLHKISKVAEEKYKFISLVNIAADKPTGMSQIFQWETDISELFDRGTLQMLLTAGKDLFNNHKGLTVNESKAKQENIIKDLTQQAYKNKLGEVVGEKELDKKEVTEEYSNTINTLFSSSVKIHANEFLEKNPHLATALMQTLIYIDNIKQEFIIYSEKPASVVTKFLPTKDAKYKSDVHAKGLALNTFADMVISSSVEDLYYTPPITFASKHMTYQGTDAFVRKLAAKLKAIEKFENKALASNPGYKPNMFLQHLAVVSKKPFEIKAAEAHTIQDFNSVDYFSAFKSLAYFKFKEEYNSDNEFVGYSVTQDFSQTESVIQQELVDYAIFKYGLRPASNNYVSIIDPDFLRTKTKNITKTYQTFISDNANISNLWDMYILYAGLRYPASLPKAAKYKLLNKGDKEVEEIFSTLKDGTRNKYEFFDKAYITKRGSSAPKMLVYNYNKKLKGTTFYVLSDIVIDDSQNTPFTSAKYVVLYKRMTFGEVLLFNKPYEIKNHFRVDRPTLAVKPSTTFDLFTTTVLDDQGNEIENTFEIPYEEKFHSNLVESLKENSMLYGYQVGDVLRKRLVALELQNTNSVSDDGKLILKVINSDVNEEIENKTQRAINREDLKQTAAVSTFSSNQQFIDLNKENITEDDAFVYLINNKNIPSNKQAKLAFYSDIEAKNDLDTLSTNQQFDYAMSGVSNKLVQGIKQKGYGLELFKLSSTGQEHLVSNKKIKQSFVSLFEEARKNPDITFKLSIPNSILDNVATAVAELYTLEKEIPSNIQFNSNFTQALKTQIKNRNKYNFAIAGEKGANRFSEEETQMHQEAISQHIIYILTSKKNIEKAKEIKKNCEGSGGLTAESGLTIGFTPGSKWSLVKDLKGPSHAQGGIDLSIDNGKVMFSSGGSIYHAANGLVVPKDPPDRSLLSYVNPKNWGVNDYSKEKDFSSAYSTARKAGEKEFIWNNKRYNSNMKNEIGKPIQYREDKTTSILSGLIPDKQQRGTGKNTIYFEELSHYYKGKDYDYKYLTKSRYKPINSKNKSIDYISINDDKFKNRIIEEWNNPKNKFTDETNTQKKLVYKKDLDALGNFNIHKGSDERGEYISYYDLWDVNALADKIGKPFEVYDRIYIKDYGDSNKKRMYYSDKELSELDIDKKDFDTLGLQRELSNRKYKLSKSTKQDGSLDGIWGDETKNALLDYQKQLK